MRPILVVGAAIAAILALSGYHLTHAFSGLHAELRSLSLELSGTSDLVTYRKDPMQHTGTLSKIVNGTTITLDYTWDGTAEDWKRIKRLWAIICAEEGE